ncbi:hypothetical protein [Adhaeribacter soli]|uniref:Glycosyltransferase RgtA/B/C/D-like domain-containing protein n=1 Tax=Adhaeribacter soli TaxID=2607655 RepID=A0A5N1J7W5_9BACT|nr:hypothetical protein [Adhaeribacter soli]KAA9340761.1 hypothetical protein F0P94_04860 [Adhaeribacter soli]
MNYNVKVFLSYYLPVTVLLLALRYYLVGQAAFPDYDSVRNWEIVQEVAQGKFQNVFHHRSPAFFLFYSLFVPLITDFHQYIYINALFGIAALLVLVKFTREVLGLKPWEAALMLLLIGSCVFLTYSGRFFTIESPSLLIFILVLKTYYYRFLEHSRKKLYQTLLLVALGLALNYKFLSLLPVALVLEVIFRDGVLNLRTAAAGFLILISPYLFFALFSVAVGLPFYQFPATYSGMVNFTAKNPAQRSGKFQADFFYYFKYLFYFESPLVWAGLLGAVLALNDAFKKSFNLYGFLGWVCCAILLGMSLLLKAPRGLLFVYPLLYLFAFLTLRHYISSNRIFIPLILGSVVYNLYRLEQEVYSYSKTSYDDVARYLQVNQVNKIAGTVSLGLKPYLPAGYAYEVVLKDQDLNTLKEKGFRYVLADDYRKVTNIKEFDYLEKQPAVIGFKEPWWQSKLIYLEHSEFTGLGFEETLALRKEALSDTFQLRLVKIP